MDSRLATADDRAFLRDLHHRAYREVVTRQFGSWDETAQDAWFEQTLTEAEVWVVSVGGTPVGAIALALAADCLHLVELQILPEWQNQGLGTALVREQLARARAHGVPLRLRVLHENRARHLYERHGLAVCGTTPTHYLMEWRP
jgi:ribosomal protein S18 acetylase RimI-like enzyme